MQGYFLQLQIVAYSVLRVGKLASDGVTWNEKAELSGVVAEAGHRRAIQVVCFPFDLMFYSSSTKREKLEILPRPLNLVIRLCI